MESEKKDKQLAHRRFRASERDCLSKGRDLPLTLIEVSDNYCFGKDGKQLLAKSSPYYEKVMRK